jgi:glutathionylspermidine synthase
MRIPERRDWREKVEALGFIFHTVNGEPYWNETAYYRFSPQEIDVLEQATNDLHGMCLTAVEYALANERLAQMGIPDDLASLIAASWDHDHPTIYGRFDLAYDGRNPPKMLEYNADTPTSLLEAGVIQWQWLEDVCPKADQFNAIHEKLLDAWRWMKDNALRGGRLYLASLEDVEDEITVAYMMDVASQAGIDTSRILLKDIGWDAARGAFVDLDGGVIGNMFKLYPWEWMAADAFWSNVHATFGNMLWIEPAWKVVLSSKGILPILWELYPGNPLLLEAYFDDPNGMAEHVCKPLFSREGANVTMTTRDGVFETGGDYGGGGCVFQAFAPLISFDGNYPVLGSWIIGDAACGMGIRESLTPITGNASCFVPHCFEG